MIAPWIALVTASLLAACALLMSTRRSVRRDVSRFDTLYFCALFPFAALALLDLLHRSGRLDGALLIAATRIAYQCMILGVTALVVALVRDRRAFRQWMLVGQAGFGFGLALLPLWGAGMSRIPLWTAFNLAMTSAFVLMLTLALWRHGGTRAWLVLLATVPALGVMATDLLDAVDQAIDVSWAQIFYAPVLALLWLVATRRVKVGIAPAGALRLTRYTRQRIAQDLHDGVGGHLSSLISSLNLDTPHERAIAARLHECLAELKLLVDGEDDDVPVLTLLASLRYRMEPLLAAAGIRVEWRVVPHGRLDGVRGDRARHILRIAQEAFANIVRHSDAMRVVIRCGYVASEDALALEIVDDGVLWPPAGADGSGLTGGLGKGIRGMHERADMLGGTLTIEGASPDGGTRIALRVPVEAADRNR